MREIRFRTLEQRQKFIFDIWSGKAHPAPGTKLVVKPAKQRRSLARAKPPKLAKQVRAAKPCVAAQSLGAAATSGDDPPDEDGEPPPGHDNWQPLAEEVLRSPASTQWEREFAANLLDRWAGRRNISPKQRDVLERIYAKCARQRA